MKDVDLWLPWVLLGAVSAAVLSFGGTEPPTLGIVQATVFLTAIAVFVRNPEPFAGIPSRLLIVPLLLLLIVAVQLAPLPSGWFSDGRVFSGGSSFAQLSIDPAETKARMVQLLACISIFVLVLRAAHSRKGLRVLVYGLALLGLFEAVYGLVQYLTGWQQIFAYVKIHNLNEATGTYINRNHYAGLLAMTLPFCLALAWFYLAGAGRRNSALRITGDPQAFRGWFWFSLAGLMFVALIFSRSRMGILAVSVSSLVLIGLIVAGRQKRVAAALSLTLLFAGIGLAVWIGPGPVIDRFERLGDEVAGPQTRPAIWVDTFQLVAARPLLGTGLGTFTIAYTSVQTAFLGKLVNSAHNDYLEFASDLGLPAALLLFAGCGWVLWLAMRQSLAFTQDQFARAISLGVTGALLAILLHSCVDFNLQIPANALVFSFVLGLGCASAIGVPEAAQDSQSRRAVETELSPA